MGEQTASEIIERVHLKGYRFLDEEKENEQIPENIPIARLEFSPRTYNALYCSNIVFLKDLLEYTIHTKKDKNSLYTIHNLGEKSAVEIIEKIHFLGYLFFDEKEEQREKLLDLYNHLIQQRENLDHRIDEIRRVLSLKKEDKEE